jgi:3-oxoacyl-[acyl-carrier protein] reductase
MSFGIDLADQVVIVTGGGRGIGNAICKAFGSAGAHVVVNYSRSASAADEVVSEIADAGGSAEAICFDVSDAVSVDDSIKAIARQHGRIDVLVNNAGIAVDGLLARTKQADWQRTIEVNLSGAFYCSKAVSRSMMKQRTGSIINISSVIGEVGNAGQVAYSASKSGLFGLTKSLARELGSRNVTVNAITPGYIATEMTAEMGEDATQALVASLPLGRLGSPEDISGVAVFLASTYARYITGQVLGVNGGMAM